MSHSTGVDRPGFLACLSAFIFWGLAPLYFYAVRVVPPLELVAHRIVWSVVFIFLLLITWSVKNRTTDYFALLYSIFRQPRLLGLLTVTALLTGSNWLVYIWAISVGRLVEASLGYFITPLIVILLGRFFLNEQLRPLQKAAIAIASIGVLWRIFELGSLPWVALYIGSSFAFYGLLRKRAPIDSINGLLIETLITLPLAAGYLIWLSVNHASSWEMLSHASILLPLAGIVTATPLLLFAFGAKRLPLSTVGFLQYISPSIVFLLAVLIFREPFDSTQLIGFILIWSALAVYSIDMIHNNRLKTKAN